MAIQLDGGFSELKHVDDGHSREVRKKPPLDLINDLLVRKKPRYRVVIKDSDSYVDDEDDYRKYPYNPYITLGPDAKGIPDIFEDQPERLDVLRNPILPKSGGFIAPPCRVCRTKGYQCGHYYYDEMSEVYTMKHCFMCGQYGDHYASTCPLPEGQKYEAPDSDDDSDDAD